MTPHWLQSLHDPQVCWLLFDVFCVGVIVGTWACGELAGFLAKAKK